MSKIYHPIFTNYYLTPDGDIMNSRDREAKQSLHNGKMVLTIRANKKNPVKYPVDKSIYEAAVGRNISSYLDIIHVNGSKLDNSLSNLKLVVNKSDNNPYKDRVNIIATNLDTGAKTFYFSISSAGKILDRNPGAISLVLNEKRKRAKSKKDNNWYTFSYKYNKKGSANFLRSKAEKSIQELESKKKEFIDRYDL